MSAPLNEYELGIAWTWEYDREFVSLIESEARTRGIATTLIDRSNVERLLAELRSGQMRLDVLLDRASDEDEAFHPLHRYLADHASDTYVVNPLDLQMRAADKATMHLEFMSHGINVPYTIIISPYADAREPGFSVTELQRLGRPFIIKPANTTGGGIGVVLGAETLKEVLVARQRHEQDKYLLQETIRPTVLNGRRAWFRVIVAFGSVFPCWWDEQTHEYEEISPEEEAALGLSPLRALASRIGQVCGLEFFSTEIALTSDRRLVVVDYVNEICDMRPKSGHRDGVPDRVVRSVAQALVAFVRTRCAG